MDGYNIIIIIDELSSLCVVCPSSKIHGTLCYSPVIIIPPGGQQNPTHGLATCESLLGAECHTFI